MTKATPSDAGHSGDPPGDLAKHRRDNFGGAPWSLSTSPAPVTAAPQGRKGDDGKARMGLLPPAATIETAHVLSFGARKYDDHNWKLVPNGEARYVDACLRHIFAHLNGERLDEESGRSHLAHAAASILMALDRSLEDV